MTPSGHLRDPLRRTMSAMLAVSLLAAGHVAAQELPEPANRIKALVHAGRDSAALRVADSILADTDPGARGYPDALYWRGMLLKGPAGRVDLIRLTVNYPTHPRVADALYALAQQDLAAGDQEVALHRLDWIVRDFVSSDSGARAAALAGRLHLGLGQMRAGCAAFDSALAHAPEEQVEFRTRTAYEARPCERWKVMVADSIAAAARTSAKSSGVPAARTSETSVPAASRADMSDNTARNSASGARQSQREAVEARGGGRWTVQIAAYAARADAERLRRRLLALGYDARVVLEAPYRVRVGHFAMRQSAMDVAARLKRQRFDAIVVEVETP